MEVTMRKTILAVGALLTFVGSAHAGPVADFELELRQAYGHYRTALFTTNSGKPRESAEAVAGFASQWQVLSEKWGISPPPQYVDDAKWPETLAVVRETVAKAGAEVEAGQLPAAHATLEQVRDAIGELHERNGIELFSDRMNAYHAEMEKALGIDLDAADAAKLDHVHEVAAVLTYLAADMLQHPPADARGAPEFEALAKAVTASVVHYAEAARARNVEGIRAATGALKPAYARLFLKFG
jgi:hypothetical protein